MANHGFVVGSKTIEDAYMKLELAESYAQVVLNAELLGGAKLLTEELCRKAQASITTSVLGKRSDVAIKRRLRRLEKI